jgi:hypothetical protein
MFLLLVYVGRASDYAKKERGFFSEEKNQNTFSVAFTDLSTGTNT